MKSKLTGIGNSTGVILPKELLDRKRLAKGDSITITETATGFEISAYDEEVAHQLQLAREIMKENKNLLRELAK